MGCDKNRSLLPADIELRRRAEEQLKVKTPEAVFSRMNDVSQRLVQELQVHQIELEMQNAELCRTREDVETSLAKYTDLYDFAPVGYFTLDRNGTISAVNLNGASLFGIERSLLIGRRFVLFASDKDRPLFTGFLNKVFANQGKESCEVTIKTEGKSPLSVQIEAVSFVPDRECHLAVIDITARKRAEDALHESEELNRKTLQALPAHIAVINRQGEIIAVNNAWMEFAHSNSGSNSPDVAVGANYCDVCRRAADNNDADAMQALAGIEDVLSGTNEQFTMEYPCHSPQQQRWFVMTVVPLGTAGQDGAVITHLNITDRKLAEEQLQKAHDEMELRVKERTAELNSTNLQLKQEISEREKIEESLIKAYAEINLMKNRLKAENIHLQQEIAGSYNFGEIIGQSTAISYVFFRIEQVAPMDTSVLLLGETGTGKGVVARAIHSRSARKSRPMITVNCTALPGNLIESELFGRERGAFTGADSRQMGRFELADGGTIFLDEIGEMPMELQPKLLRVIQDGEFERLGSPRTIKVNVRIIAASNRNLEEEIKNGRFRKDLFYRLNVFPITIPPLRQRKDDIPLLVNHFVAKFNKKVGKKIETVSKQTLNNLQEYHWPGNVRELESVIERAVITSQGSALQVFEHFDTVRKTGEPTGQDVKALADLEHDHIIQALQKTGWRVEGENGAAVILGLNPSTLRARMRKYGIRRQ
ncbi:MAG: sigma 54-interacting transcriptional regulator [Desulfuromonadales bacterium]|nr:sigma 54-interacting transcriptional regulator [Desulfuromonadales bacterium]